MDSTFWVVLATSTLTLGAPLILAALGGFMSERSGVINIALEGKMLMSCAVTGIVGVATHNPWLGVLAGIGSSVLLSLGHWLVTQGYQVDHIVSGMAVNAFAVGATNFLDKRFTDPAHSGEVPQLPTAAYYILALGLPLLVAWAVARTRPGLRLRAAGSDPEKARIMGLNPPRIRLFSLLWTGVFCGLSGALIVSNARFFTDGMTAGRGFIALAALIIGGWRPIPTMAACLVFGFLQALQIQLQGTNFMGVEVPREVWMCLPYAATIIALAGFLGKMRPPAGLGKP